MATDIEYPGAVAATALYQGTSVPLRVLA